MSEQLMIELRQLVWARVIPGFVGLPDVESDVRDWAEDTGAPADQAVAEARRLWAERDAESRLWTDSGDYGRLQAAFDELDAAGVLSRMNFACCATCATHDIDDERTPNPATDDWYGYREWAYVYFHEQDAEGLADDEPMLYLGYSAFRPHPNLPVTLLDAMSDGDIAAEREVHERTETLVATQIVDVLRRHGLDVTWSGSRRDRIAVRITAWRKTLPQSIAS
ncbi:hypothetical protein AAFP30_00890 [Gordonia sp. CPCC 205515]|uniref:DUF6891 domain-containing protein n=1 Tax=Gordonia sp. CPCC 205515 TaxID=3140791 RepID=UPI003AF3F042